jgi:GT2 family glycosyltransferase
VLDIRVPYATDKNLGKEYNRILAESTSDWVLLLDHDVFLALNRKWYEICVHTMLNHSSALATCWTNKGGSALPWIAHPETEPIADLNFHKAMSKQIFNTHGFSVTPIKKATGFFMLINKKDWQEVGGFPGKGMVQEDWGYCDKLNEAGKKIVRMDGLYVYHMKARSYA